MNHFRVNITFDYELFFGAKSGTVQKCMIEPTEELLRLAADKKVKFVFFIDAGFLAASERYSSDRSVAADLKKVADQLRRIVDQGHEIGLHVHPHWEDTTFEGGEWKIDTRRYKLADFSEQEANSLLRSYHSLLSQVSGAQIVSYRAGGWCIQPFSAIGQTLHELGIKYDSSVYPGGVHRHTAHSYDFSSAPNKAQWKFEDNECVEIEKGSFTEFPITPDKISPLFYYDLYWKMKTKPSEFKPVGDGSWLKDQKKVYQQFYKVTNHFACCDGYFASRLNGILGNTIDNKLNRMVVLGHPKSMAPCSFKLLADFIEQCRKKSIQIEKFDESN